MPAWIEPARRLPPWAAADTRQPPQRGVLGADGVRWRAAGTDWVGVEHTTGGWAMLSTAERSRLEAADGSVVDLSGADHWAVPLWRRGLVSLDGETALGGVDWDACVEQTREHYGLILVLNSGCNLACTYCYLGHASPGGQNDADPGLVTAALDAAMRRPEATILVDFGEIAAAPRLFRTALAYARRRADEAGKHLRVAVQTNATTLGDDLLDLLVGNDVLIGVSLDGPEALHDRARTLRSGRGTHAKVTGSLARCRDRGLPFHLIVTVGAHNVAAPDEVLDEIARQAPASFLCKPVLAHGEADAGWREVGASPDAIAHFLRRTVERAAGSGLGMLDQSAGKFLARMLGDPYGWRDGCTSRHCGSGRSLHVLSARGEVHACPRFVTPGQGARVDGRTVGLQILKRAGTLDHALHTAPETCGGCPWLRSCGGGCTLSGQHGDSGVVPLPDEHCASYTAQHEEIVAKLLPALVSGRIPLDGPLTGAKVVTGA
ncbi:radical SAM protein [Dactylosporangium sp. NPDC005555]|uniref:radical SAM/SPASM domain-containing protein n=1 Tax=Dactylosporangium sp. NPDC005555 TaxID=3154889 RepID=UPI0033AA3833